MGFPENVLDEIATAFPTYFPPYDEDDPEADNWTIVRRPVGMMDPNRTIGIFAQDWMPQNDSQQIGQVEPALGTYKAQIHLLVKHTDQAEGRAIYTGDSTAIRGVLYRSAPLRVALGSLNDTAFGAIERFKRMRVEGQRYLGNEVRGSWIFHSATILTIETEVTQL